MRHVNRVLVTLVAAAAAGCVLWYAPHFNRFTTGGYWGLIAVMALAGALIGLSQLYGRDGSSTAGFIAVYLPVLVAAGWVILAAEPRGGWIRDHVLSWSGDMGIGHAVHNLGEHVAVLGFSLGVVFGLTFEPRLVPRRRKKARVASTAGAAAPSPLPVPADRVEEEAAAAGRPSQLQHVDAAPTVEIAAPSAPPASADPEGNEATVVHQSADEPKEHEQGSAGQPT